MDNSYSNTTREGQVNLYSMKVYTSPDSTRRLYRRKSAVHRRILDTDEPRTLFIKQINLRKPW